MAVREPRGGPRPLAENGQEDLVAQFDRLRPSVGRCLCFGWIDSLARRIDDDFFVQKFSRRTARSPWSKRNVEIVARLDAAGLLEPSGIAEIEKAKADGRWDRAYEGSAKAEVPKDFLDALAENPKAREFYATLNSTNRFTIAYRLQEQSVRRREPGGSRSS